ncbi:phosphatidylglycerophosphatase A family protein [Psychrobacter sp. I-STPA10]|uniref:phosphatidylglycerophosphatase A family protein n=1 Tax=Psychrobacter sp. I-STPA10 TaxID=2585769 RepID=UPI001E46DB76|nr:phosphatidylglycerophosphatase A [Psychrobacter sp. I-STPA10]
MTDTQHHKPDVRKANDCPPLPANASAFDKLIYWLGIGLGSGMPKRAAGTWGTVGGLIVSIPLMALGFVPFLVITIVAGIVGVYICGRTSNLMGVHDDPHIVWDEWVGMWITLLPIVYVGFKPLDLIQGNHMIKTWLILLVAFVLFRFFDISKPFPISWADKKVSGGLGVMLDDIIAGIMAMVILSLLPTLLLFIAFYVFGMPAPGMQ